MLESIAANNFKLQTSIKKDPNFIMPDLPIRDVQQFEIFNKSLLQENFLNQVLLHVYDKTMATTLNNRVKLLFENIVSYELITKYSWTGKSSLVSGKN